LSTEGIDFEHRRGKDFVKAGGSREQKFFDRLSSQYQHFIRQRRSLEWMRPIIEPRMGKRVLDVGSGGVREFFPSQTSLYVGVDLSHEMLREGREQSIQKVCGEATILSFKRGVFDTVFYQSLLHHLAEKSPERTMETVKMALLQGFFCLREEGNVMVVEPCLPSWLERFERVFFILLKIFLFLTKQPGVFLFSSETLGRTLLESGYHHVQIWKAEKDERGPRKWIQPCLGFPLLRIPRWLNPARRTILVANKQG